MQISNYLMELFQIKYIKSKIGQLVTKLYNKPPNINLPIEAICWVRWILATNLDLMAFIAFSVCIESLFKFPLEELESSDDDKFSVETDKKSRPQICWTQT